MVWYLVRIFNRRSNCSVLLPAIPPRVRGTFQNYCDNTNRFMVSFLLALELGRRLRERKPHVRGLVSGCMPSHRIVFESKPCSIDSLFWREHHIGLSPCMPFV